jgi:hypothetical protein
MKFSVHWQAFATVLLVASFAQEAGAQTTSPIEARARLLQQLQPGIRLRLESNGERTAGKLSAVTPDSVILENGRFAVADVDGAWIRQRSTRKGMQLGALIGAPVGAVFGVFLVWFADALCENACNGVSAGELALGAVGFGAFGLVSGGTIGATIGATIPRWGEITDKRTRVPSDPDAPIGSVSFMPAFAQFGQSESGGGFGGRANYTFETRNLAVGFEAGTYSAGTTRQLEFQPPCDANVSCFDTADVKTSVFHVGGVARVVPGGQRGLKPYASLGVGVYNWDSDFSGSITLAGYSVGAGLQMRNRNARRGLFAEARWQSNLSRSGHPFAQYGFYSFALGSTFAW